ncbi:Oxysterol-binding protein [Aix galericulata]|nr:Oxysterol-binding protein [Aix galericulata]
MRSPIFAAGGRSPEIPANTVLPASLPACHELKASYATEMSTEAEQQLLHDARNGNAEEVKQLLDTMNKGEIIFDINCKGRSKSNMGWTPLHLACYFGHAVVVEDLLKAGADVNVLNDMGDTPLHRAAFTGRKSWLEAIEDHSAYSTHYCTQEQLSSDDEEDDTVSVTDLQETLKGSSLSALFLLERNCLLHAACAVIP